MNLLTGLLTKKSTKKYITIYDNIYTIEMDRIRVSARIPDNLST